MRCYYTYTDEGEKILIPGCMQVVHTNDITDCICRDSYPKSFKQFENREYRKILNHHKYEIKRLQSEIKYLHKVIENLTKTNK